LDRVQGNGMPGYDPSQIISHRFPLEDAPDAYELFDQNKDECIKVVLIP
jgi:S-(hydroxymethyl)glutathione dehydrogenase/alcohol dehydrogenase